MARGDPPVRQYRLMQLLDERREVGVNEAAAELGYSARTVYRDLEVLSRIGFPVYSDQDGRRSRWKVLEGSRQRLRLTLSWSEMLALTTGRELLRGLAGTVFHEAAVSALDKIRQALPAELAARAAAATLGVSASTGTVHDYRGRTGVVQSLVDAIDRQETVDLTYKKRGRVGPEQRRLDPYHLHVLAGAVYIIGFCHARGELRTFLVDRASAVVSTGQRFERRNDLVPTALLHGSFGPWSGAPVRVRLRFAVEVASLIAERRVHPSQTSQWRADGRLDVSLKLPESPALVAWVVSWGPRVEVVSPVSLRDAVRREHEEAVGIHGRAQKKRRKPRDV